jgi:hypothetical protein
MISLLQGVRWVQTSFAPASGGDCCHEATKIPAKRLIRRVRRKSKGKKGTASRGSVTGADAGAISRFVTTKTAQAREIRPCPPVSLRPSKTKYETVVVACGCFWSPQYRFQKVRQTRQNEERVQRVKLGSLFGSPVFCDNYLITPINRSKALKE